MSTPPNLIATPLYIDGSRVNASSGEFYQVFNPARTSELIGYAASASMEDVDSACEAAHGAYHAWSALSYAERAVYLRSIARHLTSDQDELNARIRLFTREHGKVFKEASIEMSRLGERFSQVADYADRLADDQQITDGIFDTIITRQPRGVAALVVPWNWPLSIMGAKLPQALLAGNTAVLKLSQQASLAPALTIALIAEALPTGVLNLLTGPSSRIGDGLLSHPRVRKINFTGSTAVGKHLMRLAADNLTPITLELGGNDAGLVLEDAELNEAAFMRMYLAAFMSAGQICMALKRLYVHRSRYDELVAGLSAVMSKQVIGDGLDPEVTMGPLNNRKQRDLVAGMIAEARDAGTEVREFGRVQDPVLFEEGYFLRPTLVLNPDSTLRVVREEQFGPVLPIIPFDTDEEALQMANNSDFGLCSSVWTGSKERALKLARKLEAGYTYINGHGPMAQDNLAPFGGLKQSGIGRNLGYEGVLEFQEYHSISSPKSWLL
ncbi:aldehyde dehydrogenase family protein [Marinobacter sp. ATCH36]|uniref:aldehyde dehydrogenase family protein n=1 Tax=Marinobacter sp. ATCH36 TaxID=2945106 RepID=UPI0020210C73|nr:aldehyde dehydrogenase family protein [Marinobacter sp. ATCH36]MCL7942941.1 aldehyde dehydrogenase family protein [Marinobacter sp. ATCH36]